MINFKNVKPVAIDDFNTVSQHNPLVLNNLDTTRQKKYRDISQQQLFKLLDTTDIYALSVGDSLQFRLDTICLIMYGSYEEIQLILKLNGLNSIIDFIPSNLNNQIYIVEPESLYKII